jgi:hypothetical protein
MVSVIPETPSDLLVPPAGLEPATTRLEVMRSVQLSYGGQETSKPRSVYPTVQNADP